MTPRVQQHLTHSLRELDEAQRQEIIRQAGFIAFDISTRQAYQEAWAAISNKKDGAYLYSNGLQLSRVGFWGRVWEKLRGWFGKVDRCSRREVNSPLMKLAYWGYLKGWNDASVEPNLQAYLKEPFLSNVQSAVTEQNTAVLQRALLNAAPVLSSRAPLGFADFFMGRHPEQMDRLRLEHALFLDPMKSKKDPRASLVAEYLASRMAREGVQQVMQWATNHCGSGRQVIAQWLDSSHWQQSPWIDQLFEHKHEMQALCGRNKEALACFHRLLALRANTKHDGDSLYEESKALYALNHSVELGSLVRYCSVRRAQQLTGGLLKDLLRALLAEGQYVIALDITEAVEGVRLESIEGFDLAKAVAVVEELTEAQSHQSMRTSSANVTYARSHDISEKRFALIAKLPLSIEEKSARFLIGNQLEHLAQLNVNKLMKHFPSISDRKAFLKFLIEHAKSATPAQMKALESICQGFNDSGLNASVLQAILLLKKQKFSDLGALVEQSDVAKDSRVLESVIDAVIQGAPSTLVTEVVVKSLDVASAMTHKLIQKLESAPEPAVVVQVTQLLLALSSRFSIPETESHRLQWLEAQASGAFASGQNGLAYACANRLLETLSLSSDSMDGDIVERLLDSITNHYDPTLAESLPSYVTKVLPAILLAKGQVEHAIALANQLGIGLNEDGNENSRLFQYARSTKNLRNRYKAAYYIRDVESCKKILLADFDEALFAEYFSREDHAALYHILAEHFRYQGSSGMIFSGNPELLAIASRLDAGVVAQHKQSLASFFEHTYDQAKHIEAYRILRSQTPSVIARLVAPRYDRNAFLSVFHDAPEVQEAVAHALLSSAQSHALLGMRLVVDEDKLRLSLTVFSAEEAKKQFEERHAPLFFAIYVDGQHWDEAQILFDRLFQKGQLEGLPGNQLRAFAQKQKQDLQEHVQGTADIIEKPEKTLADLKGLKQANIKAVKHAIRAATSSPDLANRGQAVQTLLALGKSGLALFHAEPIVEPEQGRAYQENRRLRHSNIQLAEWALGQVQERFLDVAQKIPEFQAFHAETLYAKLEKHIEDIQWSIHQGESTSPEIIQEAFEMCEQLKAIIQHNDQMLAAVLYFEGCLAEHFVEEWEVLVAYGVPYATGEQARELRNGLPSRRCYQEASLLQPDNPWYHMLANGASGEALRGRTQYIDDFLRWRDKDRWEARNPRRTTLFKATTASIAGESLGGIEPPRSFLPGFLKSRRQMPSVRAMLAETCRDNYYAKIGASV